MGASLKCFPGQARGGGLQRETLQSPPVATSCGGCYRQALTFLNRNRLETPNQPWNPLFKGTVEPSGQAGTQVSTQRLG